MLLKQGLPQNEHIGFLIAATRRAIVRALGRHVRRYRLTPRQFWILVAIHEHPGLSLTELATHLRMDDPTASRVVFALRKRRLIEVRGHDHDRRRRAIELAPAGAAIGGELLALATSVREAVAHGLSAAHRRALRASLRRIITNMERFHGGREAATLREPRRKRA